MISGSIVGEFCKWSPSSDGKYETRDGALWQGFDGEGGLSEGRGDRRGYGREDSSSDEESAVRCSEDRESFKVCGYVLGGSSEEIGGKRKVVGGKDREVEGKNASDDLKIRYLDPNGMSSGSQFGTCERHEESVNVLMNSERSVLSDGMKPHIISTNTDGGTTQRNRNNESYVRTFDLPQSNSPDSNEFQSAGGKQEPGVTGPERENNNRGSLVLASLWSSVKRLSGVDGGPVIDTPADSSAPPENTPKQPEEVGESGDLVYRPNPSKKRTLRSVSFPNCFSKQPASASSSSITRTARFKTLPSRLEQKGCDGKTVLEWRRKRPSWKLSRGLPRRSRYDNSSTSSADSSGPGLRRWSRLSMKKIGINVFNTVTRLFSQIVTRSPLSASAQDGEGKLQHRGSAVWHQLEPSTQQGGESRDKEDDSGQRETGMSVACGGGERHGNGEEVSSTAENKREEDRKTQESDGTGHDLDSECEDVSNGLSYVQRVVRRFESIVSDEKNDDKQSSSNGIKDDTKQCTRLQSERERKDGKQGPENEQVKTEETSKGSGRPDENPLVPQTATSEAKENEDKTKNSKTEEPTESRPWNRDEKERLRDTKEEEKKEKEEEKDEKAEEKEDNSEDESESNSEGEDVIVLRSKPRGQTLSYYRCRSFYRTSMIRPRTVIIGLGVCTETKFINDSFGDGVSETESEDEEDISPAPVPAPAPTPTRARPTTPSRSSRPHSPLSDMDTESKRNSQAVSTEPSEFEDHSSVTTSDLDCHEHPAPDSRKDKAYRIALELLHTERTYVKVLHLIDQEFQFRVDNENRAHHMFPPDVILHMFSNIKSIYKLHHDFLLPQLEERMAQWEHNRRIGDIMKSFAPFLKMYTEYVRNFDNAMTLINQWQAKCPRFAAIMDDIHSMEVCGSLTLQHHMLSPVQRIPRYEMLIRDYLKKLPEDSPDCHDTEKALHLVSTAANHANDAMKKIDKFEKLLEIQESLGGAEDLVSPTRELIKEGKIIKISARSGDHQERYIFLLTDLLLLCSPRLMGGRVMSGPQYRLRAKYHVENLIIQEGDNLETANTFYIKDNNKSVELYTQTIEEKEQWLDAFIRAIHETSQRKSSLKLHFNPNQRILDLDLGQKQPMLIRSDSVNKCMECASQFTMVRRKHHCRACGAVVCSKCSSFKASLAYECGKSVRVCRTCHATLQELSSSTATPSPEIDEGDECSLYSAKEPLDLPFRNRGVLEVSAKTSGAVIQGFLQLKTHRKTWVKRWFALHTDFVLYSFKCEADDQALTATPVPGFTVTHLQGTRNESGISDKEKERAFKLHHAKKQYIFQATCKEESQRWVAALKKASQAELPSPVQ
ncbi:FYVE, RhoGEF and PH domain-containing protein 6-like isoform X1 [Eriocheir sinensis]|uniref:FYVE, RhoGEF and PH domain-containing protein 6-like isoform X1 n=1 Tax=Eriocheir sinensis TaxID=95602 RepID=UPI0021C60865|nr:FYVE, RhoGEF and PH domain-containing protein 6-like isoform X1 [Eriocheir sinensis]XP_050693338.1 FYVE, RhoGEF and PH domain-containing protein 6-like isoform X1 [Eriocheir sinensis]